MGIHEQDSLIEKISEGSDLNDAMLIALKRCNEKIKIWIESLPERVFCLLCGLRIEKSELLFYTEDTPQFNYDEDSGTLKANRYVFGMCSKCAEELNNEEDALDNWDNKFILPWQEELIKDGNWDMSNLHTRGEAKRFIVDWLKN